jgi:hypothetical protein
MIRTTGSGEGVLMTSSVASPHGLGRLGAGWLDDFLKSQRWAAAVERVDATLAPPHPAQRRGNLQATRPPVVAGERAVQVCRVETVAADGFTALYSDPEQGDRRVRFLAGHVAPSDRRLLAEGAVFYWITGTERDASGDVVLISYLRFRRTPRLSPHALQRLDEAAREAIQLGGGVPITDEDLDRF